MGDHEQTIKIKFDDISMKSKLISTRFNGNFGMLLFGENSFRSTLIGFKPFWDSRHTNAIDADSSDYYTSEKISNSGKINKTFPKCDAIVKSVVNCVWEPIHFSFVLDKLTG